MYRDQRIQWPTSTGKIGQRQDAFLQLADDMLTLNAVWPPTNENPAFGRLIRLARRTANGGADARPGAMRYEKA